MVSSSNDMILSNDHGQGAKKVDRRILKTRQAIHEAFQRIIIREGLEGLSVSALAREASIDRKTFYLHFDSIDDLVRHESELMAREVMASFATKREEHPDTPYVNVVFASLASLFEENHELYSRVVTSLSIEGIVDYWTPDIIAVLRENGSLEDMPDAALEYMVRFTLAGALAIYLQWFRDEPDTPLPELLARLEEVLDTSLCKENGLITR